MLISSAVTQLQRGDCKKKPATDGSINFMTILQKSLEYITHLIERREI